MTKFEIFCELIKRTDDYKLKSIVEFAEAYEGMSEEDVSEQIDRVEDEHKNLGGWL